MRNYSSDRVQMSWQPIPGLVMDLREGIARGSFITEAKTSPRFTKKVTGTGKVVRVYDPDKSGTVTLTVDQESKLHQELVAIVIADDLTRNHVGPLVMTDGNTGETIVYKNAFIENEPDEVRALESQTFAWVFGFEARIHSPAPNDQNIVGQ